MSGQYCHLLKAVKDFMKAFMTFMSSFVGLQRTMTERFVACFFLKDETER